MNFLVRFEVDACYPSEDDSDVDELVTKTTSLSLSADPSKKKTEAETFVSNGLSIIASGHDKLVEQKNIIELTSKSLKSRQQFRWAKKYPQLYLSGTPTLLLGVHDSGNFSSIEKFGADDDSANSDVLRRAREYMQPGLNKLAAILTLIQSKVLELTDDDATGSRHDRLLALVYRKNGKLSMYERRGGPKLPDELVECFESS